MSLRVLLVSGRTEIEESLREDPGANAYWLERRPPDLVVPAEAAREFAIVLVDFDTTPDGLGLARALRAANKVLEVIALAGAEQERLAAESLKSGIFDYLVWPAPEPSSLWSLLAACARKVKPQEPEFPIAFGRYTLLSRLGVGGMAEVFLADTGSPPRKVVVKRMLQSLAADEFVAMFMDEARISSALVHPNIVRVYDFGRVDESLYISMEYVPGRNLEQLRLALGGPFPPAIACYIVAEMCAGLGHAHTKVDASGAPLSIVHRDVNPPNVLIADDGRVMITDFGIAKAAHRYYETSSGTLKGKFEYMSPEQANGRAVDRRADVFCAGLVLYELLTGTRPFMAATPIETLFLIQECNPEPPSKWNARLPKVLDEICMKSLAKDPELRYSEASELERDLREYARGSMNPGPRDLATFTKSVAKSEETVSKPEQPVPPLGPVATSDGKVTALLHRMKQKEGGAAAPVPLAAPKLNPLVQAALEDDDDTPPRPVQKPPPPVAPPAVNPAPSQPSRTTTAPMGAALGEMTMPGVLAELEEHGEPPSSSGGTFIVPAEAAQPRTPQPTVTASGELFPSAARNQDRVRFQMQLGAAIGVGLLLAIFTAMFIGPGVISLFATPEPTPYAVRATPTPLASVTLTAIVPEATTAVAAATAQIPPASPVPTRSVVASFTPSPIRSTAKPVPTRAPLAKGTLSIWVEGWAKVEIDGRPAGSAPFVDLPISAGKHRVVLTSSKGQRRELEVVVQSGRETRKRVSF